MNSQVGCEMKVCRSFPRARLPSNKSPANLEFSTPTVLPLAADGSAIYPLVLAGLGLILLGDDQEHNYYMIRAEMSDRLSLYE